MNSIPHFKLSPTTDIYDMKLSEWAKSQGISYKTAWRWFNQGKLPVPAKQTATGTILVQSLETDDNKECVVYARVSSTNQKDELDKQVAKIVKAATQLGLKISNIVTEIGSYLNEHRPKLMQLLNDPSVKIIAIEHKNRLMRFGYKYVESTLLAQGRNLVVINNKELKDDLSEDNMTDIITSFCASFHGRRISKKKAKKILALIKNHCGSQP